MAMALQWPWSGLGEHGLGFEEWGLGLGTCGLVNSPATNRTQRRATALMRSSECFSIVGTCESEISARIESQIESGGSRLHVQCRLSCGSCVCALATAVQLHVKWSCKNISQLQTAQRSTFLLNSE